MFNSFVRIFINSDDEDVAAEENFQISFTNVVNFLLLIYTLISGVHALLIESFGMAISNMTLSVLFIFYFLSHYVLVRSKTLIAFNRMVIFAHFIISYINASVLGFAGLSIMIYPFIAIILHGRRSGIALSIAQIVIELLYTLLCYYGYIPTVFNYSWIEVFIIFSEQMVAIFCYYIAIRWLSLLIYDRITEVGQLNEALSIKTDLVKNLSNDLKSQIHTVENIAEHLSHERMNPRQMELVANLKVTAGNLAQSVETVTVASEHNIRPIPKEETQFNIFNLISNVLVLYGAKLGGGNLHSVNISSDVPQNVVGNNTLIRQVFITSFDSLDRKFGLSSTPMKVSVSMNDVITDGMILNFAIESEHKIKLDRRDLTSSESKLLYQLQLDATQRLVKSAGGEFLVDLDDNGLLRIEFTLPFKGIESVAKQEEDERERATTAIVPMTKLEDVRMLVIDSDADSCQSIAQIMSGRIKGVFSAPDARSGIKLYENSRFDFFLVNIVDPKVDGTAFANKIREIEAGYGPGAPIYALTYSDETKYYNKLSTIIDGFITKPVAPDKLIKIVSDNFLA